MLFVLVLKLVFSKVPGFRWGPSDELPSPKSRVALKHLSMAACKSFIIKGPYPARNKGHGKLLYMLRNTP